MKNSFDARSRKEIRRLCRLSGRTEHLHLSAGRDASDHKLGRLLYELYRLTEDKIAIAGEKTGVLL